jgi:replicative DNA helicase
LPGVSTGLARLDALTGGFRAKKLYVIGGRPGGGKTALMMNFVSSAASQKMPQGIFSAEMDHEELSSRLISIHGAINSFKMSTGKFDEEDWPRLTASVTALKRHHIMINDEPSIGITHLMRQARVWKKRQGIKIIFVDYIQLLRGSNNRQTTLEKVTEVVQSLKQIARELDLPVVALAQLKREADDLNKPAGMNYFADASGIEKDANFAATLWADEGMEQTNQLIIHVCKNRDGPKGDVPVTYQRGIYRITDQGQASYRD